MVLIIKGIKREVESDTNKKLFIINFGSIIFEIILNLLKIRLNLLKIKNNIFNFYILLCIFKD